ncbi:GTPase-associated system all-helical protein GASH [Tardiphaga sp. 803_E3_N1_3]|uniref:GTPase-associated system all-helical protein GASH n=1 Tax=Tardiphaga sp. 803_E3_N1_3 TaxID=3240785 RepID=UPI003F1F8599
MGEVVLQRFLNNGLINVGGDDTKLEKLSQAAKHLAGILKKTPSKALNYALIAFDPEAPEDDPVIQEALVVLQGQWATYRNTFSATPVAAIRAILLDALLTAAVDDDRVGVCFVASARNALPLLNADHERDIWVDAVKEVERRIDARAEAEWATPQSITVSAMTYDVPELEAPKVKRGKVPRDTLKTAMLAAAGPSFHDPQQGNIATDGNRYWPHQHPHQWVGDFGRRSSEAIANAIDASIATIGVSQPDLAEPFKKLAAVVSEYVDNTLSTVSSATAGLQRRTNLLWWSEALYSPSAQKSYRDLPVSIAAAQMAFDLFASVPLFSPASVSAFLSETVLKLENAERAEGRPVRELVAEAQQQESLADLRKTAADLTTAPVGRGPLLALIGHSDHADAKNDASFQRLTGLPVDAKLDAVGWATWIFRELQAAKAASGGSSAKRRAAKKA